MPLLTSAEVAPPRVSPALAGCSYGSRSTTVRESGAGGSGEGVRLTRRGGEGWRGAFSRAPRMSDGRSTKASTSGSTSAPRVEARNDSRLPVAT